MAVSFGISSMRPATRTGQAAHRPFVAMAMILAMAGVVAPLTDALKSPLSLQFGADDQSVALHPSAPLSQLVRLTRAHRDLVAAQRAREEDEPGELARIETEQDQAMRALMSMVHILSAADAAEVLALRSEWGILKRACSRPSADAATLFVQHTRLMDQQLALLSRINAPDR